MLRRIKEGDMVQAFLDPRVKGKVVKLISQKNDTWMVGGTTASTSFCLLELASGDVIKYKISELHHVQ